MFSYFFFFFSSRRRHTRYWRDWSSDVCSSDLAVGQAVGLTAGAALVGYRTGLQDLAIQGAITGLGVGILQALVLRPHVATWFWWAVAMPPLWALGWIVTTLGGVQV